MGCFFSLRTIFHQAMKIPSSSQSSYSVFFDSTCFCEKIIKGNLQSSLITLPWTSPVQFYFTLQQGIKECSESICRVEAGFLAGRYSINENQYKMQSYAKLKIILQLIVQPNTHNFVCQHSQINPATKVSREIELPCFKPVNRYLKDICNSLLKPVSKLIELTG